MKNDENMNLSEKAHDQASSESQHLCDSLYQRLRVDIHGLNTARVQRWCSLWQTGRTRFAYINHRKTMPNIEVWCLGDSKELQSLAGSIEVIPRKQSTGSWASNFRSRFYLSSPDEIEDAASLLLTPYFCANSAGFYSLLQTEGVSIG